MKILIVQPVGHATGHHSYYTRRLSESLLDTGEVRQVTVVSYAGFRDEWPEREGLVRLQTLPKRQLVEWNPSERPGEWARATDGALRVALPLVGEHDVMQVLDGWYHTVAWRLCPRPTVRRRTVFLWHQIPTAALVPPLRELPRGLRTRLRLALPVLLPEHMLYAGVTVLVHADTVAQAISRWLPRARVAVIPPGSDAHPGELPTREQAREALGLTIGGAPALLLFGFLGPHKGLHTLLEALAGDGPDLRLLIAGKPAGYADVADEVRAAGWQNRALLRLDYIPDHEVPLWFRAADAVLLAYPRHFVQNSGVLTRAADFRTPVICSDVGQMGRFVRQYGLGTLFEPEDPTSMRAAIDEMFAAGAAERAAMVAGLARYAQDHSWPSIARRHLELYRKVAMGGLPPGSHDYMEGGAR